MGTTEEPYPAAGQIMGIPAKVLYTPVSKNVPENTVIIASPDAMAGTSLLHTGNAVNRHSGKMIQFKLLGRRVSQHHWQEIEKSVANCI